MPAIFDNFTVSDNVSFTYIQAFKEYMGFKEILSSKLSFKKEPNAVFQPADIIDFMIDSIIQGNICFLHMDQLKLYMPLKQLKIRLK